MRYTLGQAAKATGKAKSTLSKAIKSRKMSAEKQSNGSYLIDPAELARVFPPERSGNPSATLEQPQFDKALVDYLAEMKMQIGILEEKLDAATHRHKDAERSADDLRSQIDDLRQDRDDWKKQAQMLITDQRPPQGLFARIFSSTKK